LYDGSLEGQLLFDLKEEEINDEKRNLKNLVYAVVGINLVSGSCLFVVGNSIINHYSKINEFVGNVVASYSISDSYLELGEFIRNLF